MSPTREFATVLRAVAMSHNPHIGQCMVTAAVHFLLVRAATRIEELERPADGPHDVTKPPAPVDRGASGIAEELDTVANHPPGHVMEAALAALAARASRHIRALEQPHAAPAIETRRVTAAALALANYLSGPGALGSRLDPGANALLADFQQAILSATPAELARTR